MVGVAGSRGTGYLLEQLGRPTQLAADMVVKIYTTLFTNSPKET